MPRNRSSTFRPGSIPIHTPCRRCRRIYLRGCRSPPLSTDWPKSPPGLMERRHGIALFRPVKTGITGTTDIEILDGMAENDEIVSGPYQVLRTLKDNTRITVEKAP